jgi:NADH-quinone oxidoreductase subunit J
MIETLLLWLFAATALVAAVAMLVLRHPMRVALALTVTMLSLAGIYALLGVHVIAVFQVLIYVGAVMVFMVYAIMLLDVRDRSFTCRFSRLLLPGIAAALMFLAILAHGLWHALPEPNGAVAGALFGIKHFSAEFLNEYWLQFAVLEVGRRHRG